MRNISFSLTTPQVRARIKTVTRRLGWIWLVHAMALEETVLLQPIEKGQGLKRGEKIKRIDGPIKVVSARRERLCSRIEDEEYWERECELEGFPGLSGVAFVKLFSEANHCDETEPITRIEFAYL